MQVATVDIPCYFLKYRDKISDQTSEETKKVALVGLLPPWYCSVVFVFHHFTHTSQCESRKTLSQKPCSWICSLSRFEHRLNCDKRPDRHRQQLGPPACKCKTTEPRKGHAEKYFLSRAHEIASRENEIEKFFLHVPSGAPYNRGTTTKPSSGSCKSTLFKFRFIKASCTSFNVMASGTVVSGMFISLFLDIVRFRSVVLSRLTADSLRCSAARICSTAVSCHHLILLTFVSVRRVM